jgi:hypothetical protein
MLIHPPLLVLFNEEHPAYHSTHLRRPARANLVGATIHPADLLIGTKARYGDSNLATTIMRCRVDPLVGPNARLRYFFQGTAENYLNNNAYNFFRKNTTRPTKPSQVKLLLTSS